MWNNNLLQYTSCTKKETPSFLGRSGATAVELLLYITILSLILGVFFTLMISVFSTFASVRATRAAMVGVQTGFERVVREARSSQGINDDTSVFGATIGALSLTQSNGSTIVFSVDAQEALVVEVNDTGSERLTPEGIAVTQFLLTKIETGRSTGVTIEFVLKDTRGTQATYPVRTSVIVRGSYE